jgi:polar amino acid transport system substrate-binding protein
LQSWAVAVPLDQLEGPYGEFMRATVTDWHKSGQLIELNREWGIQDNPFLDEMHEKYAGS